MIPAPNGFSVPFAADPIDLPFDARAEIDPI
jgi:hypothetical protein